MATSGTSSVKSQKKCQRVKSALESAVLEWLLICMLFIDAILSYLITKFACYYELQTPCLLCSRLDHILGNKKLKYYWDLICGEHKLEISTLVLCHAHGKLVDVHGMCETCLFSFATINKSNAETYRLLVGKLGEGSSFGLNEDPLLENHTSSPRHCSCCNEPWIPKGYSEKLMQTKIVGSESADFDGLLSGDVEYEQDNLKNIEQSLSGGATHQRINSGPDHLSHIGYAELNINSDNESEVMFSDDDNDSNARNCEISPSEDIAVVQNEPRIITLADDLASEKLIDAVTAPQIPISISLGQPDLVHYPEVTSVSPTVAMGHCFAEFDRLQAEVKSDPSVFPELISTDEVPPSKIASKGSPVEVSGESKRSFLADVPQSLNAKEMLVDASTESTLISVEDVHSSSVARETPLEASEKSKLIFADDVHQSSENKYTPAHGTNSKPVSVVDVLPLSSAVETPVQGLEENCIARTEEIWQTAATDCEEICKTRTISATMIETAAETNPVSSDSGPQMPNLLDLSDAYKLAIGSRGRQLSDALAEQWIGKDSSRLGDDLKLILSQLSAAREHSLNDTSPRVPMSPGVSMSPKLSLNCDELKNLDASSVIGMQILQRRISLERNESLLSLDGSMVSEIEGESVVDRLKRQIEHDKKLLSALYKELEEERNASAIAANQTMAMITRLQEEKAAFQMEALQYLRMMEEQAEYDMELLVEKEKELKDLEAELEFYRNNLPSESLLKDTKEHISEMKTKDIKEEHSEVSSIEVTASTPTEKPDIRSNVEGRDMACGDKTTGTVKSS
ncbi:myosin-binding protein 1 isoform X2 [Manihot esculenta]|uniref:GTD-binding domain-containing protein n=2 Tax=Manihot esculenta TaxID=3983 RepID=A0A251K844_MANES|nr:myosin-binding protein 1 isoform X2 [Manihot esculenta]KAG8648110.1 hypothetical protein MANES_09G150400v8 [Manihot esculenta]OAY42061.1 hypothetical protein MANES_09G150400v8 [Manihot esculenta]OAY42062.1 hypothetical protein MANES_09G150400v8 [Manihot esculenta]